MTKKPCCLLSYRVSIGKVEVSELADFSLIFLNDRFGVNDLSSFERLRLVDCCRRAVAAARDNQLASGIGTLDFTPELLSSGFPNYLVFLLVISREILSEAVTPLRAFAPGSKPNAIENFTLGKKQ